MKKGKVYLVGAGPGKSDLITVRGLNILREADVVIHDYLVDRRLLGEAKEDAELICCGKLHGERNEKAFFGEQSKITSIMIKKLREGKKVIRLKNGDPSIFGRTSQELEALSKENIEHEIVPGVTASSAASCYSGIPLTDRRYASTCLLVTGHEGIDKKKSIIDLELLSKAGTTVLYMAVGNLKKIAKRLLDAGKKKDTPIAVIEEATLPTQKTTTSTIGEIVLNKRCPPFKPPAIVIMGENVRMEQEFNWTKKNRRILYTGLSRERFFTEGTYYHLPLIRIKPMESYEKFDRYLRRIAEFDWIVFTSRYGVEYFFKRFTALNCDARMLSDSKIAVIGTSTASRLHDFGIIPDLVPENESSKGLTEEFKKIDIKGRKIFLPRSDISDKGLNQALSELGAEVKASFAYRNVMPDDLPDLELDSFDEIVFTSPSTVRNFKNRYKTLSRGIKVTCIGDVTKKEFEKKLSRKR